MQSFVVRLLAAGIAVAALFVAPAGAQEQGGTEGEESKTEAVQADEASTKLLDAWRDKQYHLGRAGAEKASFKGKFSVVMMGQTMEGTATYKWDGEKGSLSWDNAQVGGMLAQQGWSKERFDSAFTEETWRETFAGAKLTAEQGENETVIRLAGATKAGFKAMVFDANGVLQRAIMEVDNGMGGKMELELSFQWTQLDGKYAETGWIVKGEIPGMGTFTDTTKVTYEQVGRFHVMAKSESTTVMGGMAAGTKKAEFSDFKFNDDVE